MKVTKVLFIALSNDDWVGGLYYVSNILYTLDIDNREDMEATLLVAEPNADMFSSFSRLRIIKVKNRFRLLKKIINFLAIGIFHRSVNFDVTRVVRAYDIDFCYPVLHFPFMFMKNKCIGWIPDFQEAYYPHFFSLTERMYRKRKASYYADNLPAVVLSSESAKADYKAICGPGERTALVVPFVSNIESRLAVVTDLQFQNDTRKKFGLKGDYFIISNQFWSHKNHQVVFEALRLLKETDPKFPVRFVFTGSNSDYRSANSIKKLFQKREANTKGTEYFDGLMTFASNHGFSHMLDYIGLVERNEQLALMYGALAVIQPSLFEGWGTVLEDAKILDCDVLLSDTPVHREQAHDRAVLFPPEDAPRLCELIREMVHSTKGEKNVSVALVRARDRASKYSERFSSMLGNCSC